MVVPIHFGQVFQERCIVRRVVEVQKSGRHVFCVNPYY